ncbi:MAG: DUF2975 domain-containing protein, partial [Caulobacteraceae bacterium]
MTDIDNFRRMCGQFRWLAVVMVVGVGSLIALVALAPLVMAVRDGRPLQSSLWVSQAAWMAPSLFYLFGVWTIGAAMGQLSKGRLIQPTLSTALRRVGLALGTGGVVSV